MVDDTADRLAGTVTLELTDLHGDVIATANPSSDAAPSATYTYSEFGAAEGSSSATDYGYLGVNQRTETDMGGTVLMGVRVYNPNTGRFLETDPVFGGNANAYVYPLNPLIGFDLSGMISWYKKWVLKMSKTTAKRVGVALVNSEDIVTIIEDIVGFTPAGWIAGVLQALQMVATAIGGAILANLGKKGTALTIGVAKGFWGIPYPAFTASKINK